MRRAKPPIASKWFGKSVKYEKEDCMKSFAVVVSMAVAGLMIGCGSGDGEKASARASAPKQVLKWKHVPKTAIGGPKGIVVELEGEAIATATLYDLKAGDGFATYSTIGKGAYVPAKGHIVFSNTGNLQLAADESAQINDAVRWEVPFKAGATNLAATFWLEGRNMGTIDFARFQE